MAEHPGQDIERDAALGKYWRCPLCGTDIQQGFLVCAGCRAVVVYGVTRPEWRNIATIGAAVGGMTAALLMLYLPMWLTETFGVQVEIGWGLGFFAVLPIGLVAAATAYGFARIRDAQRRKQPPRFFPA